jgi:hypothetical protein
MVGGWMMRVIVIMLSTMMMIMMMMMIPSQVFLPHGALFTLEASPWLEPDSLQQADGRE